ncbi:hypothetical protein [Thalassovita taeanensis]|nr:hypothetical protein [Thalassovita taeanensis]
MTATRTNTVQLRDAPRPQARKPRRWLPRGNWWVDPIRNTDPYDL